MLLRISISTLLKSPFQLPANIGASWKSWSKKALWLGFGAIFIYGFASATPGAIARYAGWKKQREEGMNTSNLFGDVLTVALDIRSVEPLIEQMEANRVKRVEVPAQDNSSPRKV